MKTKFKVGAFILSFFAVSSVYARPSCTVVPKMVKVLDSGDYRVNQRDMPCWYREAIFRQDQTLKGSGPINFLHARVFLITKFVLKWEKRRLQNI
jgi:hypothetical protein